MKYLVLCLLLLTGCATSTVTYERHNADKYTVTQKGQADLIVDNTGKVEIKNPQSTIAGLCLEIKDIFKGLFSVVKPSLELNN